MKIQRVVRIGPGCAEGKQGIFDQSADRIDFAGIIEFTEQEFGVRQATTYKVTLKKALTALHAGAGVLGSAARDEILPGLRSLHVARNGRRGRHFVMYRASEPDRLIEVVGILHDAMDLARHIPGASTSA